MLTCREDAHFTFLKLAAEIRSMIYKSFLIFTYRFVVSDMCPGIQVARSMRFRQLDLVTESWVINSDVYLQALST